MPCKEQNNPDTPLVSIVVPAFNEEEAIGNVTKALVRAYPEYEIIVVDDAPRTAPPIWRRGPDAA